MEEHLTAMLRNWDNPTTLRSMEHWVHLALKYVCRHL